MSLIQAFTREAVYVSSLGRTLLYLRSVKPDSPVTIVDIVERHARRSPDNPAILYQDATVNYRALDEAANRYANWAHTQGIVRGTVVAQLMENRPDFIIAWLGLLKLGAIVALINTNLRGQPLAHSIGITGARHLVLGSELADAYAEVRDLLEHPPIAWATGGWTPGCEDLDAALAAAGTTPPDRSLRAGLVGRDKAFYVFTSGTTGMPKAANISHMRMLSLMYGVACALDAKASDRIYNALPLYHTSGGVCAVGTAVTMGGAIILRRKFSTHEFWEDCFRYKPTLSIYIGELCRYLLNAPPSAHERDHALRAIVGNGLRPEIWSAFQKRFAIPKIVEFYGSTEGNVAMINYDGKVGAVGRVPHYMRGLFATRIVRFDVEKELPVRGPDGFCIECADNEVGETIGKIYDKSLTHYEGYTNDADTQKKILHDVFEKGDAWFRTGDLMKRDAHGYFYFVDRIGDTFRWKGENVATSEVAEALSVVPGILEANVYGVFVPGHDGRAGMAALVATPDFDPTALAQTISETLPAYARPIFLRLRPEMEITGTFKQRKVDLVKEGFDPAMIRDPLYAFDQDTMRYERLGADRYADILAGRAKL